MKKIIITDQVKQRLDAGLYGELEDVEIFTAYTNEDAVSIHRREMADLIMTGLYGSGMSAVTFCSLVREDPGLRRVSIMVFCRDNRIELGESSRCRANLVMTLLPDKALLLRNIRRLLAVPSRGLCRIRFSADTGGPSRRSFSCRAENISVTGMLIEADADLSRGDRIHCSLVLPPSTSLDAQAEIVWAGKSKTASVNRYGVRFSPLDPTARRAIETLVLQHSGR